MAMKRVLAFVFCLTGAGVCLAQADPGDRNTVNSISSEVRSSCEEISPLLARISGVTPSLTEGEVQEPLRGRQVTGCRVSVLFPTPDASRTEVRDPVEALRDELTGAGWVVDPQFDADGPGTTLFGFRRSGVLCFGSGGAPASVENGTLVTAEEYEIAFVCTDEAALGTGSSRVDHISLDFPQGELRLLIRREGETRLFYGALPSSHTVMAGTFDIDEVFDQVQTRLHGVVPAEARPPGRPFGMVTVGFDDGRSGDSLLYDREYADRLFEAACRNRLLDAGATGEILDRACEERKK